MVKLPRPTDAELQILTVLWELGPATVREVHDRLASKHDAGYTTILKLMQIMTDKGLVERDESQRSHIYRAKLKQEQTQKQLLGDLLSRALQGSANRLVMRAIELSDLSSAELAEIRLLITEKEKSKSPKK